MHKKYFNAYYFLYIDDKLNTFLLMIFSFNECNDKMNIFKLVIVIF